MIIARRCRREQSQDVALCDVIVRREEGDAIVDGDVGRRANHGERGGDRVAVRDAVAVAVATCGGRRLGREGEGHNG